MHPITLQIIVGVIQRPDLQLTPVARARVHFSDVERSTQKASCPLVNLPCNGLDLRVVTWVEQKLGHNGCFPDFSHQRQHLDTTSPIAAQRRCRRRGPSLSDA